MNKLNIDFEGGIRNLVKVQWNSIQMQTVIDKPKAEAALAKCYRAASLEPPKRITWCAHPFVAGMIDVDRRRPSTFWGIFKKRPDDNETTNLCVTNEIRTACTRPFMLMGCDSVENYNNLKNTSRWMRDDDFVNGNEIYNRLCEMSLECEPSFSFRNEIGYVKWFLGHQEHDAPIHDLISLYNNLPEETTAYIELTKTAGWGIFRKDYAILCAKPLVWVDDIGIKVMSYGSYNLYSYKGKLIPNELINSPQTFNAIRSQMMDLQELQHKLLED